MLLVSCSSGLFAQNPANNQNPPPPLPTREISGIVKDSTDLGVIGATVSLTSDKDTLKTSTNNDGIFVFKNVKSAVYTIVVQSIGYRSTPPMRFKQNDTTPRIVMDPIVLKDESNTLNTVVINGTPSITYKTDTVEYKASDYVVRKNATVDELLKKMEGMEVGTDGSLTHQGQTVTKAKVNGKDFIGGDIANAIKNLPAEIVDKIQIVDDYGDQAARTGIKDGDPSKVLNITTRTDKSVGNMANINAAAGSNDRYDAGIFATRINGNQTIGLNGNFKNTVNGVNGGDGGGGASGGTTKSGNGSVSVRDKLGEKIEYNFNYGITGNDVNSISDITSLSFAVDSLGNRVPINRAITRNGNNDNRTHNFKLEVEANIDSLNFLRVIPTFRYNSTANINQSLTLQRSGIGNQDQTTNNKSKNKTPEFGGSIFYQHIFPVNKRRNLSFQVDLNSNDYEAEQDQLQRILYLNNAADDVLKDSLVNRIVARNNLRSNYRSSFTYVEPLSVNTQLEFNAQLNYNGYDNSATTRNVTSGGISSIIDSLSNIFKYSFTQGRVALNFRYGLSGNSKVRFSTGVTGVPALLSGTKVSLGTKINRESFNLIPIARFEYLWSRQHRVSLNYSGNANEPTFDQIQPVRDVSNPQNPIIGNPNLRATFVHTIRTDYNNYIANAKLNYSVNINTSFTQNAVVRNTTLIRDPSYTGPGVQQITETRFENADGVYRVNGNYSISKQLANRKYNLTFAGRATIDNGVSIYNGVKNLSRNLTLFERIGPRINPTEWFEINPNVSYNHTKQMNTVFSDNEVNTLALNVDGRIYLWQTHLIGYNASKNFISGISANVNNNPFVLNMYYEKELFERRGKIGLQVFDVFNQNNYINRDQSTDGGYTDTKSNALSRYFMLRLSMRLQRWSGKQPGNGREIRRRGDGSFF
ncbi:outer membrane beta-barrel protein [Pedobacter sp. PWIIR3]